MANSFNNFSGDGSTTQFPVNFPYISRGHVEVYVDGVEDTTFTWLSNTQIQTSTTPANGSVVSVRRKTPTTPLTDFVDGSVLGEDDLDRVMIQSAYLTEETSDGVLSALRENQQGDLDATGRKIVNISTTSPDLQDAITKEYHDGTFIPEMDAIKNATIGYRDTTLQARDTAVGAKNAASTSATNAAASESAAATSETNAATSESQAAVLATDASTAENNAWINADNASDSALEAMHWANTPEGFLVAEGDQVDDYSALHHAEKARSYAIVADAAETSAAGSEINAQQSADAAATSEANAQLAEGYAAQSALAAATSETNAATSETATQQSEDKAFEWAHSEFSVAHPTIAGTFQSAFAWATLDPVFGSARKWATEDQGVNVNGTTEYSAKHYALETANLVASVSLPVIDGTDGGKLLRVQDDPSNGYRLMTPGDARTHIGAENRRYIARMDKSSTAQAIPAGAFTKVLWERVVFDTHGNLTSTAGDLFVIPTGVTAVRVDAGIIWESNSSGQRVIHLRKNNNIVASLQFAPMFNSGNTITSGCIGVQSGDVLEVYVLQNTGGSLILEAGNTWFTIETLA